MHDKLQWLSSLRLKTALWLAAISLCTFASISLAGLPWVPMVSVAVAAAAVSVSKLTLRLIHPTCFSCGLDLSSQPIGAQGIACPKCGSIRSPGLVDIARLRHAPTSGDDDASA